MTTIKDIVDSITYSQFVNLAAGCNNEAEVIARWESWVAKLEADERAAEAAREEHQS